MCFTCAVIKALVLLMPFFNRSLLNFTNTSAVHKVTDRIIAFGDIINAIKEAEAAANKANKTADHAIAVSSVRLKGLPDYL